MLDVYNEYIHLILANLHTSCMCASVFITMNLIACYICTHTHTHTHIYTHVHTQQFVRVDVTMGAAPALTPAHVILVG